MPKSQGIVMKTTKDSTIIYTAAGDFLQIPTPKIQPVIGDVIEVDSALRKTFKHSLWKLTSVAAMLLLVLSLTLFNVLSVPRTAAASVVLDFSQSVELVVNKEAKVIDVRNLNGNSGLISGDTLKGMEVYQAVDLILNKANSAGLMPQNKNLVLASIIPTNSANLNVVDADKLRSDMREEMLKGKMFGDMMVMKVEPGIQQKASQLGMTVNDYQIYSRFAQRGSNINPEAFRSGNIPNVLAEAHVSLESLFPQESCQINPPTPTHQQNKPLNKYPMGNNTPGQAASKPKEMNGMQQPHSSDKPSSPNTRPMNSSPNSSNTNPMNGSANSSNSTTPSMSTPNKTMTPNPEETNPMNSMGQ